MKMLLYPEDNSLDSSILNTLGDRLETCPAGYHISKWIGEGALTHGLLACSWMYKKAELPWAVKYRPGWLWHLEVQHSLQWYWAGR
jgi:hypothetical protein